MSKSDLEATNIATKVAVPIIMVQPRTSSSSDGHDQSSPVCKLRLQLVDHCARGRLLLILMDHYFMSRVNSETVCQCPMAQCQKPFENARDMITHVKTCKRIDDGEILCPCCGDRESYPGTSREECSWSYSKPTSEHHEAVSTSCAAILDWPESGVCEDFSYKENHSHFSTNIVNGDTVSGDSVSGGTELSGYDRFGGEDGCQLETGFTLPDRLIEPPFPANPVSHHELVCCRGAELHVASLTAGVKATDDSPDFAWLESPFAGNQPGAPRIPSSGLSAANNNQHNPHTSHLPPQSGSSFQTGECSGGESLPTAPDPHMAYMAAHDDVFLEDEPMRLDESSASLETNHQNRHLSQHPELSSVLALVEAVFNNRRAFSLAQGVSPASDLNRVSAEQMHPTASLSRDVETGHRCLRHCIPNPPPTRQEFGDDVIGPLPTWLHNQQTSNTAGISSHMFDSSVVLQTRAMTTNIKSPPVQLSSTRVEKRGPSTEASSFGRPTSFHGCFPGFKYPLPILDNEALVQPTRDRRPHGEETITCPKCHYKTSYNPSNPGEKEKAGGNLRRHVKRRHRSPIQLCIICKKTFSRRDNMQKHCRDVHPDADLHSIGVV
ncbi:PR domain zinc finger protein 5 [Microdochium nivale]|nr:PR domain zinc finger protein 5 [Microdochium nivale]